jgi:hypothetical protein
LSLPVLYDVDSRDSRRRGGGVQAGGNGHRDAHTTSTDVVAVADGAVLGNLLFEAQAIGRIRM